MSAPFCSFEDVQVMRAGKAVLEIPGLTLAKGEVTAVVGDNGSGKTTLLMAAGGLLDLARGRILMFGGLFHQGRAPAAVHLRRRIAFVFQEPYLFGGSVRSNLAYGLKIRRMGKPEREDRVDRILERLGITGLGSRRSRELSGGEQRLVALGRALVLEPEVLLLDEVTANLADVAARKVEETVSSLVSEKGVSVLLATHQDRHARTLASTTVHLRGGRLIEAPKD
jgi:tungstate transport system ATP-binding protein